MKSNKDTTAESTSEEPTFGLEDNHPIGTGIGLVGGAAAGAAMGSALGPLGAVTGAVLGAGFGSIAGKGIAESVSPDAEQKYWRSRFREEPYVRRDHEFEDYAPAYALGREHYHPETPFETAEKAMSEEWAAFKGSSGLHWSQARHAARASWTRAGHSHQSRRPQDD